MLITLPVKPYTSKFLARHIGNDYKLRLDDPFGNHLFALLQKNNRSTRADKHQKAYTCTFPVQVCQDKLHKKGARGITGLTVVGFNNFTELIFKHEFHSFVETWTDEAQLTVAEAIRRFCARYKLTEDDISQDSLRRSYLRYTTRRNPQVLA